MPELSDSQTVRRAALRLIGGVTAEGRLLSELTAILDPLPPEDRARAGRLAAETLRQAARADALMKPWLQKPPPLSVRNILRLGVVELSGGGAAHGIVNDLVEITAKTRRTASLKGLVNAILRKAAAEAPARWSKLPPPRLPRWLRDPLAEAWGKPAVAAMEAVFATAPPLDLTAKDDPAEVAALTGGTLLPGGSVRLADAGQISALPGYAEGKWWVQDAAAALPVRLLAPQKGEAILDLCAAPGGKTLQLAAAGASVTAMDQSEARLARVRENLARTGLSATVVQGDALTYQGGPFDAILLDAPCSATGTLRRHPDLPHAKDGSDFAGLIAQQGRMIDHALTLLRPGGRLMFCTCSLLPDEGEVQVEEALARHPGLTVDASARDLPGIETSWHSPEGGLRLRPDHWAKRGGLDGFYMALLRKPG
jgi:16S rRNA (cytosine967-C5)-methyltransferase